MRAQRSQPWWSSSAGAALACALTLLAARPASAQNVLLLPDDDANGSGLVSTALTNAGMKVTLGATPVSQYNGANPATAGFDVIVILAGTPAARMVDMPAAGQNAIVAFVAGGGGLVNTEWAALNVSANRWQILKPLVLLARAQGTIGNLDYTVAPEFVGHALWTGLAPTIFFASASNVGSLIPGPGVLRVATSVAAGDAVVIRDTPGVGRIVQLSTAGNSAVGTWMNADLQKLMVNAAGWASKSRVNHAPKAFPGGPYTVDEGASLQLSGGCQDIDVDQQVMEWDFTQSGKFTDAMGPTPVFSAAALTGPLVVPIALRCTDTGGLRDVGMTMVTVKNVAPTFTSMPLLKATEAILYNYDAAVSDPGAKAMPLCSLKSGPMGMNVTGDCHVRWTPTFDQARAGKADVTLLVTDQGGATGMQSYTIQVGFIDSDMDSLPDTWELLFFGDLKRGPGDDPEKDGRPNLKEYQDGTDPTKYDGPSAPVPVAPVKGERTTAMPKLSVVDATSPLRDPLLYEFQLYADAQLQKLIDVDIQVMPGGGGTTFYTPRAPLMENSHYWWRSRARDAYVSGPWTPVETFFVDAIHEAPTAPLINAPLVGTKVKGVRPVLEVVDARSPDELLLTYTFEVYGDAGLTKRIDSVAALAESPGTTSYVLMVDLEPYAHYWWRARATDSMALDGPWSQTGNFLVAPLNPPPSPPIITAPADGARLATKTPLVTMTGSVDPTGEPVRYICELDVGVNYDSPRKQVSGDLPMDAMTNGSWTPALPLEENLHYCVRCRGADPSGTSGWTQSCFLVDVKNDPPSTPVLQNPSDGGHAAGDVVRFTWNNSLDPEGDPIRYELEVYADAALTRRIERGDGGDGPTGTTMVGVPAGALWWRARAVDVLGAASEWSQPNAFEGAEVIGLSQQGPQGGCGCALGGRHGDDAARAASLVAGLGLLGLAFLRRRRRG